MKARCLDPAASGYRKYGAKGVTVCKRWQDSYESFLADMGSRPDGMTIDRVDNDKGYEPGNCRWATQKTQQNNRTNNRTITHNGMTKTIAEWAETIGVDRHSIVHRIRLGWPTEKVLSPLKHGRSHRPLARSR